MPLFYLPLIMYTSWMEFMLQPLRPGADRGARAVECASTPDRCAHL